MDSVSLKKGGKYFFMKTQNESNELGGGERKKERKKTGTVKTNYVGLEAE
jgi:hypothetical protein